MGYKQKSGRELFKQYMEGNVPYLIKRLEEKRKEQEEIGQDQGALDWPESLHVAAYATFYAAEDLLKSSDDLRRLTRVLTVLTAILAVLAALSVFY